MTTRRKAREASLRLLYTIDLIGQSFPDAVKGYKKMELWPEPDTFSRKLLRKTLASLEQLDSLLKQVIEHWSLKRLLTIDRNILRLATTELLFFDDIPPKVTINEYIELAKRYGDKDSPSFVNGVLDKVAHMSPKKDHIEEESNSSD